MRNSSAQFSYSLSNLPFFILPVVAWLGSSRRNGVTFREWAIRLTGHRRV
jgi:hypothetical protein